MLFKNKIVSYPNYLVIVTHLWRLLQVKFTYSYNDPKVIYRVYYYMLNIHFLCHMISVKHLLLYLTVCIVVKGKFFQSHAVSLTLVRSCPVLNSSEIFSRTMLRTNFMILGQNVLKLSCLQTDRDMHTLTQPLTEPIISVQLPV